MPSVKEKEKSRSKQRALVDVELRKLTKTERELVDFEDEKPPFETTTLWDYPKQSYGRVQKGNNKFQGVTPAFIIWNMIQRYTQPGDLVVDPMAGSGTTVDVCKEEDRKVIGYDLYPQHPEVIKNDARHIPLKDSSVDMVFVDSPYGDNVDYSNEKGDIGKLSAEGEDFYSALDTVAQEIYRILKPGKIVGWLIGDQWVKKKFTPVGFKIYKMLEQYFEPVDLICVARRNQSSNTGVWHYRARKFNFFLRGFKNLIIMRKPEATEEKAVHSVSEKKVNWKRYK